MAHPLFPLTLKTEQRELLQAGLAGAFEQKLTLCVNKISQFIKKQ